MRARDVPGQLISAAPDAVFTYTPTIVQAGNTFTAANAYVLAVNGAMLIWGSATATNAINASLTISLPTGSSARIPLTVSLVQVGMVNAVPLRASTSDTTMASVGTVNLAGGASFTWYAMVPVAALA